MVNINDVVTFTRSSLDYDKLFCSGKPFAVS